MPKFKPRSQDVLAAARIEKALALRAQRYTYAQIAQAVGWSDKGTAYAAIKKELEARIVAGVDEMRREEADMLDELHRYAWKAMLESNASEDDDPATAQKKQKINLWAMDRLLVISERRARLFGFDTPKDAIVADPNAVKVIKRGGAA